MKRYLTWKQAKAMMALGFKMKHRVWGSRTLYVDMQNSVIMIKYVSGKYSKLNQGLVPHEDGWEVYENPK